ARPRVQTSPPVEAPPPAARVQRRAVPALGPSRAPRVTGSTAAISIKPAATLACPMVAAVDEWLATTVQPAALRWFNQPVAEIRQISAYSCRGMNGNPRARISEHAVGNALDIASFTLADGRRITVKGGWRGRPEEQGFLRDVQGGACDRFTTVLAPGSNRFHYDHVHIDLMRRAGGRRACNPRAVSGEEVAARARAHYAKRGVDPSVTGSVGKAAKKKRQPPTAFAEEEQAGHILPRAVPGEDGED
ncbi:MAG: extensin family protein, partial [Xanthobacteraceae bacterium]